MVRRLLCLVVAGLLTASFAAGQAPATANLTPSEVKKYLQIPSPEWRDQVIYFVMPDRFFDGNPANSDQKSGEYDPTTNAKYSGGDLAGLTAKLDYIKGLGATGVWITPPVANQWWDPLLQYGGYHGYWGENFVQVDKHMGSLEDYQLLSATLHKNGMVLIQDIAPNHTGNFFHFEGVADPENPTKGLTLNLKSVPVARPSQKPFDQNDFSKKTDRNAAIYHWSGNLGNGLSKTEMLNNQLSDLDDLNTENPLVIEALKDSYSYWIKTVGVDGFRVDSVNYVPHEFWNEFHWSTDKKHPGIMPFALSMGKKDFFIFGEDWETNGPYLDKPDKTMASFLGTKASPELSSVLNFSLNSDLRDVFSQGKATDALSFRFVSQYKNFPDPTLLVNFIDNHDMDRYATSADKTSLQQSLLFLFTVPGIPVLYYGTEQGFTETRASMFEKGYGSGGVDHFDPNSEGYQFVKSLTALRAAEKELSRGRLQVVKDSGAAGVFAYTMTWNGRTALMVFNTSSSTMVLDKGATGLPAGTVLNRVFGINDALMDSSAVLAGTTRYDSLPVDEQGLVSMVLPPRSAVVLVVDAVVDPSVAKLAPAKIPVAMPAGPPAIAGPTESARFKQDPQGLPIFPANVEISGILPKVRQARLVIGGNLDSATPLTVATDGSWTAVLPVDRLSNGVHNAVVQARNVDGSLFLSNSFRFRVELNFTSRLAVEDPVGDDRGPTGNYSYPKSSTFTNQNDIKSVEILTAGSSLQVKLTPAGPITSGKGGPNGFDHVAFYLYLQVPGKPQGATVLPFQNAAAPDGLRWTRMAFFGGWNTMLFSADGASLQGYGAAISPAGKVEVDKAKNQIIFTFGGESLGSPPSLSGTKIYITTWDYDSLESSNRKLTADGGDNVYGGTADGPLVMDDTAVIVVP